MTDPSHFAIVPAAAVTDPRLDQEAIDALICLARAPVDDFGRFRFVASGPQEETLGRLIAASYLESFGADTYRIIPAPAPEGPDA